MTRSPYMTENVSTSQQSARTQPPRMAILHHGATTSADQIVNMMVSGSRQVSAHAVVKDGRRIGVVEEENRAWSLSDAFWDSAAFTVETANESVNGWTISAASHESLAILVADWAKRYGWWPHRSGDPKTWTVIGHREVSTIHGGSYATACPGGMDLNYITARAQQILTPKKESDMIHVDRLVNGAGNAYLGRTRVTNDATGKWVDLDEKRDAITIGQLKYFLENDSISEGGHALVTAVLTKLAGAAATVDADALAAELAPLIAKLDDAEHAAILAAVNKPRTVA